MNEFLELMEKWDGFRPASRGLSEAGMARALDLLSNKAGHEPYKHRFLLTEAITTSDFPVLFGGVLDRQMLALYQAAMPGWRSYVPTGTLADFRVADYHKVQGNQQLLERVNEKAEYPETPMAEARYHRQVFKRGRKFDISWEAVINDAMDAFGDIATRFANAALYTEGMAASSIYAAAGGPSAALFGAPIADVDGQNVTNAGVLPLTIANLEITMQLMSMQTDVQGRPLGIRGVHLVVPPMLEFTARQILTSALKSWIPDAAAAASIPVPTANVISQMGLQLHIDPNLPIITGVLPNSTWYLFADKAQGKYGQLDFLRGHETPEICMKASNKVTLTGGPVSPFDGDFDTDNILWRVRHVLGETQLDPRYAYAQVGP